MLHKYSPFGYSLINEIDWHSPAAKDSGIKAVWGCAMKTAYIILGEI